MEPANLRRQILQMMLRQQITEDMDEFVGLEMQKADLYKHLEEMLCIPREDLESTIEKQYPDWVRSLPRDQQPPDSDR